MIPVQTQYSNMVYRGNSPGVGDLHCQKYIDPRLGVLIYSVWQPTREEREAIAKGANIRLGIVGEPIPPVIVETVFDPSLRDN